MESSSSLIQACPKTESKGSSCVFTSAAARVHLQQCENAAKQKKDGGLFKCLSGGTNNDNQRFRWYPWMERRGKGKNKNLSSLKGKGKSLICFPTMIYFVAVAIFIVDIVSLFNSARKFKLVLN